MLLAPFALGLGLGVALVAATKAACAGCAPIQCFQTETLSMLGLLCGLSVGLRRRQAVRTFVSCAKQSVREARLESWPAPCRCVTYIVIV